MTDAVIKAIIVILTPPSIRHTIYIAVVAFAIHICKDPPRLCLLAYVRRLCMEFNEKKRVKTLKTAIAITIPIATHTAFQTKMTL